MAKIIGALRPDATAGEIEVLNQLKYLPENYIVWPELPVEGRYTDFVVLDPTRGVAILEVKDWVEIVDVTPRTFTIRTRNGQEIIQDNPIFGVREKAFAVKRKLEAETALRHRSGPHAGKLRVPYAYAVVFPRLTRMFLHMLGPVFDEPREIIAQDDLRRDPADVLECLKWPFHPELYPGDVDLIRGTLFPELKVMAGERFLGVMDVSQEQAAKEGLFERPSETAPVDPDDDLPEHGRRLAVNPIIRLVRGVAGSGKTLVLARRAAYLSELHPDWNILVVTFNKALAHKLRGQLAGEEGRITVTHFHQLAREVLDDELGDWGAGPVSDARGAITHILAESSDRDRFDPGFLAAEIRWMKESGIEDLDTYLGAARVGRGRPLAPADRRFVFDVYSRYQHNLGWRRRFDWDDVPLMVSEAIDHGMIAGDRFHAILVDEAQDFAPSWFAVLRRLLNPETAVMFMAADGAQRIYRHHSWRSLGLHVVGRTRILPHPYRMTYEIACAAAELVRSNPVLLESLRGDEEELPHARLDAQWMRHGHYPELRYFPDRNKEFSWLGKRLDELKQQGYAPDDIAIFHRKQRGVDEYAGYLMENRWPVRVLKSESPVEDEGITVGTMHAAKGLEFRAVFVPQLQLLFADGNGSHTEEHRVSAAEETRLLYVALTRARERVYLMHQGRLPDQLGPWADYLKETRRKPGAVA